MPEPVVIIGSAARPAGPAGESAENAAKASAVDTGVEVQKPTKHNDRTRSPLLLALARIASGLFALVTRAVWALTKAGLYVASHYPRHSLAAGASILILGAVLYTQLRSGKGARPPVTAKISGDAATLVAASGTNAAPAKKKEVNNDIAAKNNGHGANAKVPAKANSDGTTTASSDSSSPSDKSSTTPAPAATVLDDAPPPLPSVAEAPSGGQERQPAPGKVASMGELAVLPRAEPPATSASEHDQATATLLTQTPPEPAPLPSSSTIKDNLGNKDAVATAAAPAPATTADLSPSPTHSGEPASLPAPTGDPLQLAAALESVSDQKQSNPASNPDLFRPVPANSAPSSPIAPGPAETKPKDDETQAQPIVAQDSQIERKSVPAQNPDPTTTATESESTKKEPIKAESAQSTNHEVEKAATGTVGLAHTPRDAALVPLPDESMPPRNEPSSPAKPFIESSVPLAGAAVAGTQSAVTQPPPAAPVPACPEAAPDSRFETPGSSTQVPDTKSQAPDSKPAQTAESREPEKGSRQNTLEAAKSETQSTRGTSRGAKTRSSTLEDLTSAGWVSVPNSGKMVIDGGEDAGSQRGDSAKGNSADTFALRDVRAHAAKDVSFEQESPRSQAAQDGPRSGQSSNASISPPAETRSRMAAERVESVPHVVETNENFWTISRLYYSSGRYYRALWKANADKHPEIDKLSVNDVIMIPPVEELDPAYIDPPRTIAPAALGGATRTSTGRSRSDSADLAESSISSSSSINHDEPVSTTRTNRGSADGVPVRRSSRTDPDLDLPAPEAVTRQDRGTDRVGHHPDVPQGDDNDDNEPETRTAARPRASGSAPLRSPVYKVRQYDTLRSIARDMLGDSHRANEILDLNRDLIDDPTHLIVGQVLEMPEDARTTVRRSASR